MPNGILERFFKKVKQKVKLGWRSMPTHPPGNISMLKNDFLTNPTENISKRYLFFTHLQISNVLMILNKTHIWCKSRA